MTSPYILEAENPYDLVARVLVEAEDVAQMPPKCSVFVNRMLLRLSQSSACMSALAGVGIIPDPKSEGSFTVQLDFHIVPQEVLPTLMNILAIPFPTQLKQYVKDGSARTGVEFRIREADLPGTEYEFAS